MEGTRTFANSSKRRRREARNKKKKAVLAVPWATLVAWQMQVAAAAAIFFNSCNRTESRKNRAAGRAHYLSSLTMGRDQECINQLRLNKASFDYLCELLRMRGLLQDGRQVTVEEEVAACLHILAHAVKNRTIASRFMRSGETVSKHFHGVLNAILTLSPNFIRQSGQHTPRGPTHFEDSVGAIDGTYIPAFLPLHAQPSYRNQKGSLSQNVLAACGFDLKFQYVLPGWEGSATDAQILHNTLSRPDSLMVPPGNCAVHNLPLKSTRMGYMLATVTEPVSLSIPRTAAEAYRLQNAECLVYCHLSVDRAVEALAHRIQRMQKVCGATLKLVNPHIHMKSRLPLMPRRCPHTLSCT